MIFCTMFRHGETDLNLSNKIQGRTDVPLNETGIRQANTLAKKIKDIPFDIIYSSDLLRAKETALFVHQGRKIPFITTPLLREIDFGIAEGMDRNEMRIVYKDLFFNIINNPDHPLCNDTAFEQGETKREAFQRLVTLLKKIEIEHPNKNVALSSHGVLCELIPLFALSQRINIKNGCFLKFTFSGKESIFSDIKMYNI